MKKLIQVFGLVACLSTIGFSPAFAGHDNGVGNGGQNNGRGNGAPAPEIGASALGLILAGGIAFYVLRGRRG